MDRVVGLAGIRAQIAMLETPDGHGRLELTEFHAPPGPVGDLHAPANTPGLRHLAFAVDDIDAVLARLRAHSAELVGVVERYGDSHRLCYVRGPMGIIIELAEQIGWRLRATADRLAGARGRLEAGTRVNSRGADLLLRFDKDLGDADGGLGLRGGCRANGFRPTRLIVLC